MPTARLIIDEPASGVWNMAADEALLRSARQHAQVTLRVYRWREPTLSLGYFQPHTRRDQHAASGQCPLVRRATGGGAIIHDQELTYSLTAPISHRWNSRVSAWYDTIHEAWVETLGEFGCPATRHEATDPARESKFLCFERRAAGDVLLQGWKIGGSAQRRQRHAALQHGSLLLSRSESAPELPGIAQLNGTELATADWQDRWIARVAERLEVDWQVGALTDQERSLSHDLAKAKFGNSKWTLRR